jgi:hypothetical protein
VVRDTVVGESAASDLPSGQMARLINVITGVKPVAADAS